MIDIWLGPMSYCVSPVYKKQVTQFYRYDCGASTRFAGYVSESGGKLLPILQWLYKYD